MSAVIDRNGTVRQLDRRAEPDEQVTPDQVANIGRMARLLMRMLKDLALLKRRFFPKRIDHQDRDVDDSGTVKHRFAHNMGGRVRWWVTDVTSLTPVTIGLSTVYIPPALVQHSDTDDNTLVLVSYVASTLTLRIEEAG
jgi:hypothetical protein